MPLQGNATLNGSASMLLNLKSNSKNFHRRPSSSAACVPFFRNYWPSEAVGSLSEYHYWGVITKLRASWREQTQLQMSVTWGTIPYPRANSARATIPIPPKRNTSRKVSACTVLYWHQSIKAFSWVMIPPSHKIVPFKLKCFCTKDHVETHVVESCRHMTRHESFVIGSTNWWADFPKKQWAFPTIHSSCASIRFKMSNNNTCSAKKARALKSFSMLLCDREAGSLPCKALSPREYDYS